MLKCLNFLIESQNLVLVNTYAVLTDCINFIATFDGAVNCFVLLHCSASHVEAICNNKHKPFSVALFSTYLSNVYKSIKHYICIYVN